MVTFSSSGAVVAKAGKNVSITIPETAFNDWIEQAEATCAVISRHDWVTTSAAILTNAKPLIEETVTALAAIEAVKYDMVGYTTRIEAEDIINVLRDSALRGLSLLRDQKGVKFITE